MLWCLEWWWRWWDPFSRSPLRTYFCLASKQKNEHLQIYKKKRNWDNITEKLYKYTKECFGERRNEIKQEVPNLFGPFPQFLLENAYNDFMAICLDYTMKTTTQEIFVDDDKGCFLPFLVQTNFCINSELTRNRKPRVLILTYNSQSMANNESIL
jgi:hypothetical protein